MRRVGRLLNGPDALIGALRDAVGAGGTIVAYTDWDARYRRAARRRRPRARRNGASTSRPSIRRHRAPSATTEFCAEFIRTTPGARRSGNPGASVAAIGARARMAHRRSSARLRLRRRLAACKARRGGRQGADGRRAVRHDDAAASRRAPGAHPGRNASSASTCRSPRPAERAGAPSRSSTRRGRSCPASPTTILRRSSRIFWRADRAGKERSARRKRRWSRPRRSHTFAVAWLEQHCA